MMQQREVLSRRALKGERKASERGLAKRNLTGGLEKGSKRKLGLGFRSLGKETYSKKDSKESSFPIS